MLRRVGPSIFTCHHDGRPKNDRVALHTHLEGGVALDAELTPSGSRDRDSTLGGHCCELRHCGHLLSTSVRQFDDSSIRPIGYPMFVGFKLCWCPMRPFLGAPRLLPDAGASREPAVGLCRTVSSLPSTT